MQEAGLISHGCFPLLKTPWITILPPIRTMSLVNIIIKTISMTRPSVFIRPLWKKPCAIITSRLSTTFPLVLLISKNELPLAFTYLSKAVEQARDANSRDIYFRACLPLSEYYEKRMTAARPITTCRNILN